VILELLKRLSSDKVLSALVLKPAAREMDADVAEWQELVAQLGVAYKPNVSDTRDSPALEILETLARKGAQVEYHDPLVPAVQVGTTTRESIAWSAADLGGRDVVLILTPHDGYDWKAIVRDARLVVDTRNATGGLPSAPHVIRL